MTNAINRTEENVINSCILRSIDVVVLIKARIRNRKTRALLLRSLRTLRSDGLSKEIELNLNETIDDHQLSIARLLKPIFLSKEIHLEVSKDGRERFWFSKHDLLNGYVTLFQSITNLGSNTATHILFLSDVKDNPFISDIKAGEIHPYEEVASILNEVPPAWTNQTLINLVK